ncbi:hypothetical protein BS17DRAFT_303306 [Gyrodon lividus]|nr:hypothetical protein BS17DRAFT_303306 [Gyrodon lividus]
MTMRVYAFYEKSRRILLFLFTIVLVLISFSCWAILFGSSSFPSDHESRWTEVMGCNEPIRTEQGLHLAVSWSARLCFDAIIFVLTLWKSLHVGGVGDRTLIDILLRDGSLYFAIMTCANVGNIIAFLLAESTTKSIATGFTNV